MNKNDEDLSPVIVSACLLGVHCRYDCSTNPDHLIKKRTGKRPIIPVCPEQLGGLSTPRPAAECNGGTGENILDKTAFVLTRETKIDVTKEFLKGAEEIARLAKKFKATLAILKAKSPSCGYGQVYQDGKLVKGNGVSAALLKRIGLKIISVDPPSKQEST